MSNVDRYRPAREGYQPPSLPPKPPPPIADRTSKSPVRRREVPPAVPSPPAYSSRTSPPRPLSRRSAPSPAHSSPQRALQARPEQWFFTPEEVASTPSIIDGLWVAEERLRRAKGVNFIYQAGILLSLPQTTLWVAGVFFHRFYMRCSMVEEKGGIHHYNIAATALFLANKTEENCRKTKDLIIAVGKVAQKNAKAIIDEQSKEYWRWRDSILTYEELMLEMLTFDLMIDIPYHQLYKQLEDIGKIHDKPIRDAAWAFCNDACLTILPLLMTARDLATSAIFFATTVTQEKIDDLRGEAWWRFLDGNEVLINKAISIMTEFYKENPLKKQDSKIPGSPEFNLESTRRRGENIDAGSSRGGTPIGTDRGTQSPGRANGREDNDGGKKEDPTIKKEDGAANPDTSMMSIEMASQRSRGDSDALLKTAANEMSSHDHSNGGLKSPVLPGSKRKSVDMDVDSDGERDAKKARLTDEDEGEIR
ncbi:cyclin-like protein [Cercophora newfieldiana]|uniref:RNA polymerase II holoenzyme cyclin-like subunit n=1 Tax=Cercophora newfieldiana TaxID=92897 RepID=A0AA39YRQ8_9PEZI|nr:cyclin-like protein [Cercophora newfieldiana]